jgi:GT2 family glycosyltransferase
VVDGTDDDTVESLTALGSSDSRLRVIALSTHVGVPAAKNRGMAAATSDWILALDDDDQLSEGFLSSLLTAADRSRADIIGVPWFNLTGPGAVERFHADPPRRQGGPRLDHPHFFPLQEWEECLWFTSNSLIRQSVLRAVSFDENYRGNYYREETDFFVSAARQGSKVVATSLAYTCQMARSPGGIDRSGRLRYEYWVLRNNWRFLRKHGRWLRAHSDIDGTVRHQAALAMERAWPLLRGAWRRVWPLS